MNDKLAKLAYDTYRKNCPIGSMAAMEWEEIPTVAQRAWIATVEAVCKAFDEETTTVVLTSPKDQ